MIFAEVKYFLYRIKEKVLHILDMFKWIPILCKDRDWDFSYLLIIEKYKLKKMAKYFCNADITVEDKQTAKWINICTKLIAIMLEEDTAISYEEALKCYKKGTKISVESFILNSWNSKIVKYINTKNAYRFYDREYLEHFSKQLKKEKTKNYMLDELRRTKATTLYYSIMKNYIYSWWN